MATKHNLKGHTDLDEWRRHGKRRLMISSLVGLTAVILGVIIVATLSSSEGQTSTETSGDKPSAATAINAPAPAEDSLNGSSPDPPETAETDKSTEKNDETTSDAAPREQKPEPKASGAAAKKDGRDETSDTGETDNSDADDKAAATEEAPERSEGPWWELPREGRFRLDFGEHPRLLLREGELTSDAETTYGPFLDEPVVIKVRRAREPEFEVHHVGIHPRDDRPCLAYVTIYQLGEEAEGILPLKIGDDYLSMTPISKEGPVHD